MSWVFKKILIWQCRVSRARVWYILALQSNQPGWNFLGTDLFRWWEALEFSQGLMSCGQRWGWEPTSEKNAIFVFLRLAQLTYMSLFRSISCKWYKFIFLYRRKKWSVYICHALFFFIYCSAILSIGWFQNLGIVNDVVINADVWVTLQYVYLESFNQYLGMI